MLWTLAAAFPLVFRSGPLQSITQIAYIVFLGHILMATVIDIDHWRHVYLLFGILWGADRRRQGGGAAAAQGLARRCDGQGGRRREVMVGARGFEPPTP